MTWASYRLSLCSRPFGSLRNTLPVSGLNVQSIVIPPPCSPNIAVGTMADTAAQTRTSPSAASACLLWQLCISALLIHGDRDHLISRRPSSSRPVSRPSGRRFLLRGSRRGLLPPYFRSCRFSRCALGCGFLQLSSKSLLAAGLFSAVFAVVLLPRASSWLRVYRRGLLLGCGFAELRPPWSAAVAVLAVSVGRPGFSAFTAAAAVSASALVFPPSKIFSICTGCRAGDGPAYCGNPSWPCI